VARALGYGGLANTAGARSFAGKEEAEVSSGIGARTSRYVQHRGTRVYRSWYASLAFLLTFRF
jgi:hypothetical protein